MYLFLVGVSDEKRDLLLIHCLLCNSILGAFLIPYCLALFVVGFPIMYMEMAFGQFASLGTITIWRICPLFKGSSAEIIGQHASMMVTMHCRSIPEPLHPGLTGCGIPSHVYIYGDGIWTVCLCWSDYHMEGLPFI